jgi:general secretion pathway protein F
MALYQGKVKGRQGIKTLEINAKTEKEARQYFERAGRIISIKKKLSLNLGAPLSAGDRQIFFTRMASMLSSRVGTSEALNLIRSTFTGKIQETAAKLMNYVEGGEDLASAIARVGSPDFPEATVALIQAGSRSGETWKALKDATLFEQELHNIKKTASKGLWVGLGSLALSGILMAVSTLYVGPKVMGSDLIKTANGLNGQSIDIGWVDTLGNILGITTAVLIAIVALMALIASIGRKLTPLYADKFIMSIPFYRDLVLSKNNFIVLYGLALLVQSGVRTEEALRLSAEGAPRGALRRDLTHAAQAVRAGKDWPREMLTLHPTDKAALLSASDRSQIANTLNTLANQYRMLYGQRLASFVPTVNLLAALFMSLAGGILFAESILPMLMASKNIVM